MEETAEIEKVTLKYSKKDPDMMKSLHEAISKINELGIKRLDGKKVEFNIGDIDSQLFSSSL